jgi:chromosome segregation ATPase
MDDEITYAADKEEVQDESASVCSEISEASRESNVSEPNEMEDGPTEHTSKLREMMLERIESIDIIQNLVEKEIEQDSVLIAEFTEKVVELEITIMQKDEEIECLRHTKNDMQLEIQQLKTKNDGYVEELSALVAQVDALADQNAQLETQNKNLTAVAESVQPIKARNQQMEEIISSITASLKDAKRCLEREMAYTARLEKDKAHAAEHAAKIGQDHNFEIESFKKRLEREAHAQTQLRKEMDALRKQLCDEQLNNTKLASVQTSLVSAEQCIARLGAEKNALAQDLAKAKKKILTLQDKLKDSSDHADPIKILNAEFEAMRAKLMLGEVPIEDAQLMDLRGE